MNSNLFKNFKTLKEKQEEKDLSVEQKLDNVSVSIDNKIDPKQIIEKVNAETVKSEITDKSNDVTSESKAKPEIIEKKRPVKKEILEAREALLKKNAETESAKGYSKKPEADLGKRTFTVFLKSDSLEFLKDLVFYKATEERQIFYNQSEALVEALELEMPLYKDISPRPDFIREQEKNKKGGRKRNSEEAYTTTTTVYIPGKYFDFIKDVTYNKVISGDLYFKDWDLLESGIKALKKHYGKKVTARPEYIREDEKQRGRRTKSDS